MDILEPTYNEPCIYCILNYDNGKMYFGLTKHFKTRVKDHVNSLKNNKHCNSYLQRAWNKKQKFVIFPVEKCELDILAEREIFWIDYHKTTIKNNGYNLTFGGEDLSNLSEESLIKKANNRRGKSSSLKGKKQSPEWIEARMVKLRGQKRNYTEEHLTSIKNTRQKSKGIKQGGVKITIINMNDDSLILYPSIRDAAYSLNIDEKALTNKFYKTRRKILHKEITLNNYKIIRHD